MSNTARMTSEKGIDIRKALEILSTRSAEPHSHPENGDGGCHHNAPKAAIQWGQRIDLEGDTEDSHKDTTDESIEAQREKLEGERAKRRVEIEEKLNSMSVKDLLGCVIQSQHQRVASYRTYNKCVPIDAFLIHSALCRLTKVFNFANPNIALTPMLLFYAS